MYGGAIEGVFWLTHFAAKRRIRADISFYVVSAGGARYPAENYNRLFLLCSILKRARQKFTA